jgi:hypothetical protein
LLGTILKGISVSVSLSRYKLLKEQHMKNKINKKGRLSMNATPTRPSNTGPPARIPEGHKIETGQSRRQGTDGTITLIIQLGTNQNRQSN